MAGNTRRLMTRSLSRTCCAVGLWRKFGLRQDKIRFESAGLEWMTGLGLKRHLLIVGGGNEKDKLKEMCKELKISKNVTFYGETNWADAMNQMALMDVVIVPSRFEGFGLSAAEAMAMEKPVVRKAL